MGRWIKVAGFAVRPTKSNRMFPANKGDEFPGEFPGDGSQINVKGKMDR